MPEIGQDEAIQVFEKHAGANLVDARAVLNQFVEFYREFRINGASLEEDGDMLLLEWGASQPHLIDRFTDFRTHNPNRLKFDRRSYEWLGLTRQVFSTAGDEDAEFDDGAIALCLFLFFEPATSALESSNIWIHQPEDIPTGLAEFTGTEYVARLLGSRASRVNAFVSAVG